MNGYNFTERVRKVLAMAREEAERLRHEYVGTEHILLGLIREGEGVAAAVLQNLSVDLDEIQQKIEADRAAWTRHTTALIEQARRALEYARARDVKGVFDVGGPLDEACENCHLVYWYPNAPKPPGEP